MQGPTGRWGGQPLQPGSRRRCGLKRGGLGGSALSGSHMAPTQTLQTRTTHTSPCLYMIHCAHSQAPLLSFWPRRVLEGMGPKTTPPQDVHEGGRRPGGRQRRKTGHRIQSNHMVTGISDSQMGTLTPQAGGPTKGRKRHACVGVQWPERSHLLFCTFQLRCELEVLAGTSIIPGPRLPTCLLPRQACSSNTQGVFCHRGWWQ